MASTGSRDAVNGRYLLGELIGRGGMGEVFEAWDLRLDRAVALKRLRSDLAEQPEMRRRVQAEARAAARLTHPNVVAVFDTGLHEGHPFIVMERLDGRTLGDELAAGPMAQERAREVGLQVLSALSAAHENGLVHRDVKPGNILAAPEGTWKVTDFGIAKSLEGDSTVTQTGELLGTPAYLAPERLEGLAATSASDLYSVGVVLYEALAGRRPFDGEDPWAIAMRIRQGDFEPLSDAASVDRELWDAVERAMAREPVKRFSSAEEMATALRGGTAAGSTPLASSSVAAPTAPIERGFESTVAATSVERHPEFTEVLSGRPGAQSALEVDAAAESDAYAERPKPDSAHAPRRLLIALVVAAVLIGVVIAGAVAMSSREDAGRPSRSSASVTSRDARTAQLDDALDRLEKAIHP
jgi:eukaryotic-like serine/threonine-protein kinase